MNKQSNLATSFVAVAHYTGPAGEAFVKSAAFSPISTIQEIFNAFWPAADDIAGQVFAGHVGRLPFRIEILPDVKTIPAEDKDNPF